MQTITIDTDFIKLESAIKLAGWFETGGQAKTVVQGGEVQVNGETCTQRGRKLIPGDVVAYWGRTAQVG